MMSRRRHTWSLTVRGRCLLAGGLAAIVCAMILDERDLLRIGVLAAALPVIAAMFVIGRRPRIQVAHHVSARRFSRGGTGTVSISVTNAGSAATPVVQVVDAAADGLTEGARCLLPSLKSHTTAVVRYRLAAQRRGRFTIGAVTTQFSDPLGLCSARQAAASSAHVLVVPTVVPLAGLPPAAGAESTASGIGQHSMTGGDPDVVVRPYAPGDDIRTIAWRASARHDEMLVRTLEPLSHATAAVLLDHRAATHDDTGDAPSLEAAVTLAASVSLHLADERYRVRVLDHAGRVVAKDGHHGDEVLAQLADVEPDTDEQPIADTTRFADLFVAVLGAITADDAHRLATARPRTCTAVAMVVEPSDSTKPDAPATADNAANILADAGWRTVVVRRGDDLGAAWHRVCSADVFAEGFAT